MLAGQMAMSHSMVIAIDPFLCFYFKQHDRNADLFG
jgi:hypothetical protein